MARFSYETLTSNESMNCGLRAQDAYVGGTILGELVLHFLPIVHRFPEFVARLTFLRTLIAHLDYARQEIVCNLVIIYNNLSLFLSKYNVDEMNKK